MEDAAPKNTLDGFTGHEMDHELGLINMRGRMYDPVIRRFLTPDPVVTNPLNGPFTPFFRERPSAEEEEAEWEYETFLIDLRLRTERDIARWEAEDRLSLF